VQSGNLLDLSNKHLSLDPYTYCRARTTTATIPDALPSASVPLGKFNRFNYQRNRAASWIMRGVTSPAGPPSPL
jgi:hypothetical protein